MDNNIEQLKVLAEVFNTDKIITSDQIEQVLEAILNILVRFKKENQDLNDDTKTQVESILEGISKEHDRILASVEKSTQNVKSEATEAVEKALERLKEVTKEVLSYKAKDGESPDQGKIIEEVLTKIKLPEYEIFSLEEKGEKIVSEINALPTNEDEYKIDASHIKNLPESRGVGGSTARNLYQLGDVSIDAPANNDVLKYNSATGIWENGATSGTGTVTSVAATVPTGLTISGSPITTSGTLAIGLDTGRVIPLQSTLDAKAPLASPTFTTSITGSYLTASEMLITDASKNIVSAPVATYPSLTELTYLKGVTSAIQTQLNTKQATITFGTGVQTALGVNIGSAGAPVLFNGALGTPSSGTVTNLTGTASININGTVGSTTPAAGTFTTATTTGNIELGHATDTTLSRIAAGIMGIEGEVMNGWATTATAAGTTTLAITDKKLQFFTGTTTQTVKLPTTSVIAGQQYIVYNAGTTTGAVLTVQSSGANDIMKMSYGVYAVFTALQATPTTAAHWAVSRFGAKNTITATSYTTDTGTSLNIDYYDEFIVTAQAGALLFNNPSGTARDGQTLIIAVTGTAARALTYGAQFEASTVALPTTTVTTARLNMGFIWRADTSKWVCVASA